MRPGGQPSTAQSRRISQASCGGIMAPPPRARPAGAQEVGTDERPARLVAEGARPRALRSLGSQRPRDDGIGQRGFAWRHAGRADPAWATLMRHFLHRTRPAAPVGSLPASVQQPPPTRPLVPASRLAGAAQARPLAAAPRAVPLAAVAPRADVGGAAAAITDEPAAVGAQERSSRAWTRAPRSAKMGPPGASAPGSEKRGTGSCQTRPSPAPFLGTPILPPTLLPGTGRAPRATMMLLRLDPGYASDRQDHALLNRRQQLAPPSTRTCVSYLGVNSTVGGRLQLLSDSSEHRQPWAAAGGRGRR